jgi:hypothetical protein
MYCNWSWSNWNILNYCPNFLMKRDLHHFDEQIQTSVFQGLHFYNPDNSVYCSP